MHTTREIGQLALRKLGLLRAGGTASDAEIQDCLEALSSLYMQWIDGGAFGRVRNVPIARSGSMTTGVNQHLNVLTEDAVDLSLPSIVPYDYWDTYMPSRDYGWGLNVPFGGNDGQNVPPDKSVILITDQFGSGRATYVYDGTVQRWMSVSDLTLDDEAPLSARNLDGLASVLAVRVVDQFGDTNLSQLTMRSANKYQLALVTSFGGDEW